MNNNRIHDVLEIVMDPGSWLRGFASSGVRFGDDITSRSNCAYDIGNSTHKFRNLYLCGNITTTGNITAYLINATYGITTLGNVTAGNLIGNFSGSWNGLDSPADIDHNLLNNLGWSVSGHTMDANLDMNSYNIIEIDKAYFSGTDFISSDDSDHIDIHSDSIDLHGNLSTIWNIHLTDSDGTGDHNNIQLGGQRDAWIYYNATD